jgi:hypothetical protein
MMRALVLVLALSGQAALAAAPVKFGDSLNRKFHHDRCLQCHQFNSKQSNGRAYTSHRSRYLCETCHKPALTGLAPGEWMAPAGSKMDYTGMSARDTCLMAVRNAPSGDKKETLRHHLLRDVRVLWAIDSGMTPGGQRERIPGGIEEWRRDVQAWIDAGMRCD